MRSLLTPTPRDCNKHLKHISKGSNCPNKDLMKFLESKDSNASNKCHLYFFGPYQPPSPTYPWYYDMLQHITTSFRSHQLSQCSCRVRPRWRIASPWTEVTWSATISSSPRCHALSPGTCPTKYDAINRSIGLPSSLSVQTKTSHIIGSTIEFLFLKTGWICKHQMYTFPPTRLFNSQLDLQNRCREHSMYKHTLDWKSEILQSNMQNSTPHLMSVDKEYVVLFKIQESKT